MNKAQKSTYVLLKALTTCPEILVNSKSIIRNFMLFLDSGAEASLIQTRVYDNIENPPKLKNQNACLKSIKGDSI